MGPHFTVAAMCGLFGLGFAVPQIHLFGDPVRKERARTGFPEATKTCKSEILNG